MCHQNLLLRTILANDDVLVIPKYIHHRHHLEKKLAIGRIFQ